MIVEALEQHLRGLSRTNKSWDTVMQTVDPIVDGMATCFLDVVFPINKFTRKCADVAGPTLHLPGLIKAVASNFNYKKFMARKKGGGKREYCVGIVLDVSSSMRGHLEYNAVTTVAILISSLQQAGLTNFFVVLFGASVKIVKSVGQPWDSACATNFEQSLSFELDHRSFDAEGILVATEMLMAESRGMKKLFVITDGYSSYAPGAMEAIQLAESRSIDVVGVSVGSEITATARLYPTFIHACHPTHLPAAFRGLYENDSPPYTLETLGENMGLVVAEDAHKDTSEIHIRADAVFRDRIRELLKTEREINLIPGSATVVPIDVCFTLDATGSMSAAIPLVKGQIQAIVTTIEAKVLEKAPGIKLLIRFGFVAYRDKGDGPYVECPFQDDKDKFISQLNAIHAKGGGDIPEDVLGGLMQTVALFRQHSAPRVAKFCIWIGDAPCHGTDCNDDPADTMPKGTEHSVEHVMKALNETNVELVMGHVNVTATRKMESAFRRHYDKLESQSTPKEPRRIQDIELFPEAETKLNRYHFFFLMDESGSMKARTTAGITRWESLVQAYNNFVRTRQLDQGNGDILSVAFHSDAIHIQFQRQSVMALPTLGNPSWGGNDFGSVLRGARPVIDATPAGYIPVLIFMTDGGDCAADRSVGLNMMRDMRSAYMSRGFVCHTVLAYALSEEKLMRDYATIGGGKFFMASDPINLTMAFSEIGAGCKPTDTLVSLFGAKIGERVGEKIALDYL
eukprot:PhF_6_TR29163/c1_g1_i1/m.42631